MTLAPSGRQIVLRHGNAEATIVEVGGGLRALRVGDREILDGYGVEEMCASGRGQVLIPWPNRIRDGKYSFHGEALQLPLSEPKLHNASHGLVRWVDWDPDEATDARVTMRYRLYPQPGFPWALGLAVTYEVSDSGLTVTTQASNTGVAPCPFGAGMHPYLAAGGGLIDTAVLTVPAQTALETDKQQIPVGTTEVAGTSIDFRGGREIGGTVLDTAYTDLKRDDQGRAWVELTANDGSWCTRLWVDGAHAYVMVFTGDTLSADRRRRGIAIEPMTCAPNAFNSGDGLRVLEPGQSAEFSWGIIAEV